MNRYWAHESRCGVKIVVGSYKRPSGMPGVMMEKALVKTCRFGGDANKLGMYETSDPKEIEALENLPIYGGIMGTGEGAQFVPGVSHLFFKLPDDAMRPVTAREMNKELHAVLSAREALIAKAHKIGIRTELSVLSDKDIQALIDKQYEDVKKMMNEERAMPEMPELQEAKEVPVLMAPKYGRGKYPRKKKEAAEQAE